MNLFEQELKNLENYEIKLLEDIAIEYLKRIEIIKNSINRAKANLINNANDIQKVLNSTETIRGIKVENLKIEIQTYQNEIVNYIEGDYFQPIGEDNIRYNCEVGKWTLEGKATYWEELKIK